MRGRLAVGHACGHEDLYIVFADRLGWHPDDVDAAPENFVEEILQFWTAKDRAERDEMNEQRKAAERKSKRHRP